MSFERLLAPRTRGMGASAIREILKVVSQPGMVSLAGGIPAPESIPVDLFGRLTETVLARWGSTALQYDRSEGFAPLQRALSDRLSTKGIAAPPDSILITCGSQGTLDALGKILISGGDPVAVEAPTYLGALQAWSPYEPVFRTISTDGDGPIPESLERLLSQGPVKFVYLVPNFQNPTGRTIPLDRRHAIVDILARHDTLLLEDDPYGELRYRGEHLPTFKSLAPDRVIYTSTLSKTLAPGLRIGYVLAPEPIARWMVIVKQGVDLHTSTFSQALAAVYLSEGHLDRHLPRILSWYRPRQAAMLAALESSFGPGWSWSRPEGGMFVWVEGPPDLDTDARHADVIRRGVAYVPGKYFYSEPGKGANTMRLNYTMADPATITRAVALVAEALS